MAYTSEPKMNWSNPTQLAEPKFSDPFFSPNTPVKASINGTNNDDNLDNSSPLVGSSANEQLWGYRGNDDIFGFGGHDNLYGGFGEDRLFGGDGDDFLYGEWQDDILDGGAGNDVLVGGDHNDTMYGGTGNDFLWGGNDNDTINGDDGSDYLDGGSGNDIMSGGAGNDQLWAGSGNDELQGGAGADVLHESGVGENHMWGGSGDDRYYHEFGNADNNNDGLTYIYENSADNNDVLYLTDRSLSDLSLLQSGNHLILASGNDATDGNGLGSAVVLANFFAGEDYQIEHLVDQNGAYYNLDAIG